METFAARSWRLALVGVVAALAACQGPSPAPPSPAPTGSRTAGEPRIPAGFLLHEAETEGHDDGVEGSACYGKPSMSAGSSRPVGAQAEQVDIVQELRVYADVETAKQVYGRLRADLPGCFGFPDTKVLQRPADQPWGEQAVTGTVALPADGAGEHTGAPVRMVAIRVGAAVATFWGYPQIPDIDADAQAIVGRLCLYNPDCHPRAGLPAPLSELRQGGRAWAAVLDEFAADDTAATPGVAMAAAAELGYRSAIVPAECDGGTAGRSAVTVYFTSRADAERLAAALPAVRVRTREITTYCVAA